MNGWHEDINDWHGPVDRTETTAAWDDRSEGTIAKIVEYRLCGCIIWKDAVK